MKIIILILFCMLGFLIGSSIRQYNTNNSLDRGTYIKDVALNRGCESGICPPVEEYKNGNN